MINLIILQKMYFIITFKRTLVIKDNYPSTNIKGCYYYLKNPLGLILKNID